MENKRCLFLDCGDILNYLRRNQELYKSDQFMSNVFYFQIFI